MPLKVPSMAKKAASMPKKAPRMKVQSIIDGEKSGSMCRSKWHHLDTKSGTRDVKSGNDAEKSGIDTGQGDTHAAASDDGRQLSCGSRGRVRKAGFNPPQGRHGFGGAGMPKPDCISARSRLSSLLRSSHSNRISAVRRSSSSLSSPSWFLSARRIRSAARQPTCLGTQDRLQLRSGNTIVMVAVHAREHGVAVVFVLAHDAVPVGIEGFKAGSRGEALRGTDARRNKSQNEPQGREMEDGVGHGRLPGAKASYHETRVAPHSGHLHVGHGRRPLSPEPSALA